MPESGVHAWDTVYFPTVNGPIAVAMDIKITWVQSGDSALVTCYMNNIVKDFFILAANQSHNVALSSASGEWQVTGPITLFKEPNWGKNDLSLNYNFQFLYSPKEISMQENGTLGMWSTLDKASSKV